MSYDTEELREGLIEMLDGFAQAVRLPVELGELPHFRFKLNEPSATDKELRAEIRAARRAENRASRRTKVTLTFEEICERRIAGLIKSGRKPCPWCGAMSRIHRCPA